MKNIVLFLVVCATIVGISWWLASPARSPATAVVVHNPPTTALDSLLLTTTGLIGAGGEEPLLARVHGRVKRLYFTGGEYVRRGDVLVKLTNYSFVVAPHDGFLGANRIGVGQYVTAPTLVTTLSRRRTLVVVVPRLINPRLRIHPGDSVRVWVAARPARVVSGVIGPETPGRVAGAPLEILLAPGAPFRIGERACVRHHPVHRLAIMGTVP